MTETYEPELGQMVFGNPSQELECPEYIEALLSHLGHEIERIVWNVTQKKYDSPTGNVGGLYKNDTFEMRSYYWGECTCGFDARDYEWSGQHSHKPKCWTETYQAIRREFVLGGIDEYTEEGRAKFLTRAKELGWPFETQDGIAVYCNCGYDEEYAKWRETNDHVPDCPTIMPNFRCGDFEVSWYKYLGRGMSMNREISEADAVAVLNKCMESVRRDEQTRLNGVEFH